MVGQATAQVMADGVRLHLQHGPIDIVAEATGAADDVAAAYKQGTVFFQTVLQGVVDDLDILKMPVEGSGRPVLNPVSSEMVLAATSFSTAHFVTPMAAVAGAIADAVLKAMLAGRNLQKLYVNNGGDIALYLQRDAGFIAGIIDDLDHPELNADIHISAADNVGGVATSGWRGRSLSAGVADAVTVLADSAALADVAATLIAGDVKIDDPAIEQAPASSIDENTDLGDMLVTVGVGALSLHARNGALENGLKTARHFMAQGLIKGAYLSLQGEVRSLSADTILMKRAMA